MLSLGIFGLESEKKTTIKQYYHIWNPDPRIYLIAEFREKIKFPKFKTKNALFE